MFTKILVPLDGTPESNAALPIARTLASASQAQVTLLRVVADQRRHGDPDVAGAARAVLTELASEVAGAGIQVDAIVRAGEPADEIVKLVREQATGLIVMCTHGRAGLTRTVLGSTAEKVLTHCGVPLVLLRPGGRPISTIRTLLVPFDGSPGGAVALGMAVQLARATGAAIRLFEVAIPIPAYMYGAYGLNSASFIDPAWAEEAFTSARAYVEGIAARLRGNGLVADGEAREASSPAAAIVSLADSTSTDLIVMSSHALTGPARALFGSVADAVVRTATCPVLVVHRPDGAPKTEQLADVASVGAELGSP
jgi:nucleotide-binding universal stress UspA family protein